MLNRRTVIDFLLMILGSCVFAFAVVFLLDPHNIVPGGITGVAMLINRGIPKLPIGIISLILNFPLYIIGAKKIGAKFFFYSLFSTFIISMAMLVFESEKITWIPEVDPLLAGVFGGALLGTGLGIIFARGGSTGGSGIIVCLLKFPFPHIPVGKLMLAFDALVILAAGIVFGSINFVLYAVIAVFVSSKIIDAIVYGSNIERMIYIISNKMPQVIKAINYEVNRGVTLMKGEGGYTGHSRQIAMVAVKNYEVVDLKRMVMGVDPKAFVIITEASEVIGEGFSEYKKEFAI